MAPSFWQLLIIVLIVVLLFGTKKLAGLGSDLGAAIKGFKKSIGNDEQQPQPPLPGATADKDKNEPKSGA